MAQQVHPASFRDQCGHVFFSDGVLRRRINPIYREHYDHLIASGLSRALIAEKLLIPFKEVSLEGQVGAYKIVEPEPVALVSYPYEWSFSELKDAALATLAIQKKALSHGMTLKDASAYNVQFHQGGPLLIDLLSFEVYREGALWIAYRQFCQHFLAPLALMSFRDARLGRLLSSYIDGLPLDLASRLLPWESWLSPALAAHIHLHARSQSWYASAAAPAERPELSRRSFDGLITSLESAVASLRRPRVEAGWTGYDAAESYSAAAHKSKAAAIGRFLDAAKPRTAWDLGANKGEWSRLSAERGIFTAAFDMDAGAVERHYLDCRARREKNMLPLLLDLTNPSAGIGWGNEERASLPRRGPADLAMALALIHHLALSNNVPLTRIAEFFSKLGRWLIVEFVPKDDPQAARLLARREDTFADYGREEFERAFSEYFSMEEAAPVAESGRILYLLRGRHQ